MKRGKPHKSNDGIKCPCGGYTYVRRSLKLHQSVARERICFKCESGMATLELFSGDDHAAKFKDLFRLAQMTRDNV
jgi:hypothetical protein